MRVFLAKFMPTTCAIAVVLAGALAMAQSNAAPAPSAGAEQAQAPAAPNAAQPAAQANSTGSAQNVSVTTPAQAGNGDRNPADVALEKQVSSQFAGKAEFQNVKISVVAGVVTLEGSVPTKIERRQAKALARGVNGVKKVQERLTLSGGGVAGPGTFANTTTTAQNQPNAVTGNAAPTGATNQTDTTAGGGTTGAAMNAAPPSSNVGAGATMSQAPPRSISKPTPPKPQQGPTFGMTAIDPATLASKINNALKSDPTLANNNVMVNVSDTGVEVTGSVDSGKEKLTAMRIAQSYAGNFKVVDRVTLAGRAPATNAQQNATNSTETTTTHTPPPQNVAGNQVLPRGSAQNNADPKNAGDKSTNPR